MPVWLRKFTFQKINDFYEEEAKASKRASGKSTAPAMGPNIKSPSYSTKARK